MKIKSLLTPSPPVVRIALVFFVLFLTLTFFTPRALAQGPDNLVRLAPGSWVYKVASFQLADPIDRWNLDADWKFLTNPDSTFVFRAYDRNCALEVISLLKPSDNENQGKSGAVYLGDFIPTSDQKNRLGLIISSHLSRYQNDRAEMVKVFNCLTKWDIQSYKQLAYNFYFSTAEKVSACQEKIFYYGKAAGLNIGSEAKFLLGEATKAQQTVGDDCQKINSQNYKATMVVSSLPSATPLPTFTATPMPTLAPLPTSTLIPSATAAPKVVSTATAVAVAPVASPTAVLVVAPLPAKPERDWGKEARDLFVLFCSILTIAGLLIACIIGSVHWWQWREERKQAFLRKQAELTRRHAEESALKFAQLRQEAEELLALDELTKEQYERLRAVIIPSLNDLRMYHPDGENAGAEMYLRLRQELRYKKVKK